MIALNSFDSQNTIRIALQFNLENDLFNCFIQFVDLSSYIFLQKM